MLTLTLYPLMGNLISILINIYFTILTLKGVQANFSLWASSNNFSGLRAPMNKIIIFCKSPGRAEFEMSLILILPSILAKIIENLYKVRKNAIIKLVVKISWWKNGKIQKYWIFLKKKIAACSKFAVALTINTICYRMMYLRKQTIFI